MLTRTRAALIVAPLVLLLLPALAAAQDRSESGVVSVLQQNAEGYGSYSGQRPGYHYEERVRRGLLIPGVIIGSAGYVVGALTGVAMAEENRNEDEAPVMLFPSWGRSSEPFAVDCSPTSGLGLSAGCGVFRVGAIASALMQAVGLGLIIGGSSTHRVLVEGSPDRYQLSVTGGPIRGGGMGNVQLVF